VKRLCRPGRGGIRCRLVGRKKRVGFAVGRFVVLGRLSERPATPWPMPAIDPRWGGVDGDGSADCGIDGEFDPRYGIARHRTARPVRRSA